MSGKLVKKSGRPRLYPSIKKSVAMERVKNLVMKNETTVQNVHFGELAKYLAIMMTPDELKDAKLYEVMLVRVKKSRQKLTTNCEKSLTKKPGL